MSYYVGTKKECEDLRQAESDARGLPVRGKNVGGGRHVELGDTPGPGWTIHINDLIKHPTKDEYAYPTSDLKEEDVKEKDKARVRAAKTKEVGSLPKDWEPKDWEPKYWEPKNEGR